MSNELRNKMWPEAKPATPISFADPVITRSALGVHVGLDDIFDVLISVYGSLPNGPTVLSREGRVTKRTAQFWLAREHAPRVLQLFLLMERNPAVRRAIRALIDKMG